MRKTGFTLIELLVVIAIIAILAAILFPVYTNAKAAAGRSACLSNCKQLATGLSLYKDDNQGCWMSCYHQGRPGTAGYDAVYQHAFWMRALMSYVKSKRVFECPSAIATNKFGSAIYTGTEPRASWPAANYGINEYLVETIWADLRGLPHFTRESAIPLPTRTAIIADCSEVVFWGGDNSGGGVATGPDGLQYPDGMLRLKYPNSIGTAYLASKARHGGFSTFVYADLHVKALTTDQIKIQNMNSDQVRENPIIWPKAQSL